MVGRVLPASTPSTSALLVVVLPAGPRRRPVGHPSGVVVAAAVGPQAPALRLRGVEAPSAGHQGRGVAVTTRQRPKVIQVVIGTSVIIVTVSIVTIAIITSVIVTIVVIIVIIAVATVTTPVVVNIIVVIATVARGRLVPAVDRGVTGDEVILGVPSPAPTAPSPGGHVGVVRVVVRGEVAVPSARSPGSPAARGGVRRVVLLRVAVLPAQAVPVPVQPVTVLPPGVILLRVTAVLTVTTPAQKITRNPHI